MADLVKELLGIVEKGHCSGVLTCAMVWRLHATDRWSTFPQYAEPSALADYTEVPQSLVMWSAPTPPGGVTAEVVCLERGAAEELGGLDLRGKILFTPGHPTEIKAAAARAGAVGIVSDWTRARG